MEFENLSFRYSSSNDFLVITAEHSSIYKRIKNYNALLFEPFHNSLATAIVSQVTVLKKKGTWIAVKISDERGKTPNDNILFGLPDVDG